MTLKVCSAQSIGSSLLILLLVSCTSLTVAPTPTPLPPTSTLLPPTPTSLPPTRTPLPSPVSPEFPTRTFYHRHGFAGPYCVFQFNEDGTFKYYWMISSLDLSRMKVYETGTYRIDGNLYTVTSTTWIGCPIPPPAPSYTWTYDGQTLTFQVVGEDWCSDRQSTYESPLLYTRKE